MLLACGNHPDMFLLLLLSHADLQSCLITCYVLLSSSRTRPSLLAFPVLRIILVRSPVLPWCRHRLYIWAASSPSLHSIFPFCFIWPSYPFSSSGAFRSFASILPQLSTHLFCAQSFYFQFHISPVASEIHPHALLSCTQFPVLPAIRLTHARGISPFSSFLIRAGLLCFFPFVLCLLTNNAFLQPFPALVRNFISILLFSVWEIFDFPEPPGGFGVSWGG